jgi:hypothetical protein
VGRLARDRRRQPLRALSAARRRQPHRPNADRRRRQRPERPLAVLRRPREFFDEGRDCHTGGYGAFTGHGSRFVDDVRSWRTVEPAIDFTATAALASALTG